MPGARSVDGDLWLTGAAATRGSWTLVGNGGHVEPLALALAAGEDAVSAWSAHTCEPDVELELVATEAASPEALLRTVGGGP